MFEYNNATYTLEDLQNGAKDQGLEFEAYLEGMKKLGLVEKQKDSVPAGPRIESRNTGSTLEDGLSDLPEDKGFFEDMVQVFRQSKATGGTVDEAFDIYKLGKDVSDEQIQAVLDAKAEMDKYGPTNEQAYWCWGWGYWWFSGRYGNRLNANGFNSRRSW